jgi:hypothetical protein
MSGEGAHQFRVAVAEIPASLRHPGGVLTTGSDGRIGAWLLGAFSSVLYGVDSVQLFQGRTLSQCRRLRDLSSECRQAALSSTAYIR